MRSSNKLKGAQGEAIAAQYLLNKGYQILEKNWHYSTNAEIDIIAKDCQQYVFVEVKTRTSCNYGHPFEAINYTKLKRIEAAGLAYLNQINDKKSDFRVDVVAVINPKNPQIEHLVGVCSD